jgi:hypothetical protein
MLAAKTSLTGRRISSWRNRPKILFIDFKSAFDKVNRRILFRKLEACGIPSDWLNTLRFLYKNASVSFDGIRGS